MENIKDLRNDLIDVYEQLRNGKIGLREAKERANLAGKVLSSAKLQMEYNVYTKSSKRIKFLDSDE
ncbi:hypothetical protein KAR91_00350 [Candidatus Pacearchaeota archaeon]|nr:hypothetical protein [Candidatus Pacearchaeota archaeon]